MTVTWQTIITAGAVLSAVMLMATLFTKGYDWLLKQKKQSSDIEALKTRHEEDIKAIKEEQAMLVYGILACLKGLKEQGCNGPVTEAIDKLDKHLNKKAHE